MNVQMKIPFNKPTFFGNPGEAVQKAIASGHTSGLGPSSNKCEDLLGKINGSSNLLVSSATHALEMMALLLNVGPEHEVIIPSFTFVSSANAFALRGAKIRFADNDEFGNISPGEIDRLVNKKTRAVLAVHYAGNSCDLYRVRDVCSCNNITLLEDAAQAIGSKFKGKNLGTIGDLGCYSFHETKNITSGEGGSLIVNSHNYLEAAQIVREKGTNRSLFLKGMRDKYTWVGLGSSYLMSDINAAYLLPQLESFESIQENRRLLWQRYHGALTDYCARTGIRILEPLRGTLRIGIFLP